jgi:hypothetical protein
VRREHAADAAERDDRHEDGQRRLPLNTNGHERARG